MNTFIEINWSKQTIDILKKLMQLRNKIVFNILNFPTNLENKFCKLLESDGY